MADKLARVHPEDSLTRKPTRDTDNYSEAGSCLNDPPTTPNRLTHIPVGTTACELCHAATNVTTFSGTNMKPGTGSTGAAGAAQRG